MSRPDVASAVRAVIRHAHNPVVGHWKVVRKVVVYLKGTKGLVVAFRRGGEVKPPLVTGRCNDGRSVSGVAFMCGNTSVTASSTTQHCLTISTSEARYVTMVHGAKTALAIKAVLELVRTHIVGSIRITRGVSL